MLIMEMTRARARDLLSRLEPAQFRMVELLADGHDVRYIAERFGGTTTQEIYRQLGIARRRAMVAETEGLVRLYRRAQ